MDVEALRDYCLSKPGVTESFPFDESTLVFKVMGKMFALVPLERNPPQCNLKCDPDWAIELREEYDGLITPGFHMSKVHWNTILLHGLPPKFTLELVNHSYDLVVSKMTKKMKEALKKLS